MSASVRALIESASARLSEAGVVFGHGTDSAWDEATRLVLGIAGLPDDVAVLDDELAQPVVTEIERLLKRRVEERVPLPYLLGQVRFAGLDFAIEPGVVVPRSPIGELIEQAFAPWLPRPPARIIDLCCGSGCIGIAAAKQFPHATLTLVDIDQHALALAERNSRAHGIESRTTLLASDGWSEVPAGAFELILTNPPYVDAADMAALPPEFRAEPAVGLAGGKDGLDVLRTLLAPLGERLAPGGLLVGEVGRSAPALLRAFPQLPVLWPDLEGGGEGVFLLLGD